MNFTTRTTTSVISALAVFIFSVLAGKSSQAQQPKLECRALYQLEQVYFLQHVKYNQMDADLQKRVIDQYIKKLDPTKVYLLQSDVDEMKKTLANIYQKTKDRDCTSLDSAQKKLATRVNERAEFVKNFLGKDYKFDDKTEIVFDPDKKAFPKTKEESEDYLKKYVHFQISNYLVTDIKLEEAKANVRKNWDRISKKLAETNEEDIYAQYMDAFARSLDPHSSFFSRDVFEDFDIQMSLSLEGIGATLSSQDGFTVIEALVPGGAAARSSLMEPSDKIIAVGQAENGAMENVVEMDLRDVVKKIRGPKGSTVRLKILRKGKSPFDIKLVRDKIKLEDEAAAITYLDKTVDGKKKKIGLLNFPSFYLDSKKGGRSSAADMKKLIAEAKTKKIDGLVLDLSQNGGGSLEDAVKISGLFFQTGNVVKQSTKDPKREALSLKDIDPTVDWTGPLVILTSKMSASASEIVSGTLKDYKRAVVVGSDHTFGKGSVQSVLPIPPNLGALKITVGMFYTAGGNSTQHRGVDSDIVIPSPYNYEEMGEKELDYSLPPSTITPFLSQDAYVSEGGSKWFTVNPEWIKSLQEKSKARVAQSADFKKMLDEQEKNKAKGKVIKLSEVSKEKDKKEKAKASKNLSKADKEKEYLKRADVQEATNILADLIALEKTPEVVKK